MASTAVSVDANAVTTSTTVRGECSLAALRTAMPSTLRMRRSVTTRSKLSAFSDSIAASPPSATATSYPAWRSMMASRSRMLCSSSTTRTRTSGMGGEGEGEGGAGAGTALDVDLAAVLLDDTVHQGQTDAAAVGLGREEGLEDLRQIGGDDALTGVGHPQHQIAAGHRRGHAQLTALGHGLEGVHTEIPDRLPELLAIDVPHERGRELAHHLEGAGGGAVLEQQQHLVEGLGHVHRLPVQRRRPRVLQEFADDVVEPSGLLEHD